MKSYGFILPVSFGIGFALLGPLLWHLRKELALGLREQFGSVDHDEDNLVKERADVLRSMEPIGAGIIVLLTAIGIVMMFVFGVVVAYDGVALRVAGTTVIIALIVLFNLVLFAQYPPLPSEGGGAARK
jgi:hypothetical protein